jgi:hypothetical protein
MGWLQKGSTVDNWRTEEGRDGEEGGDRWRMGRAAWKERKKKK